MLPGTRAGMTAERSGCATKGQPKPSVPDCQCQYPGCGIVAQFCKTLPLRKTG